ncbi:uncharacterized protein FMAN_06169 [Fusarium mangiferae]|uniref:Uncharacterized protein n=1 Tax=Fusarium mangiferae TaxID=192010 RepID=A0A1L7SU31_FUSMA|nr:uncharacterized protein FMAN_06169 [Fusarium mangiferae]CVK86562.1 uncharacterized protein FMAN_06169 [Fusarium mangiferae]
MRRATSHRGLASQEKKYPCVIADRFPGKCKRSFKNIEKLNEHIKRCHSPFLWCSDCLKKFNSSMSAEALKREKEYHAVICPKEPSEKNKALREKAYVIDEARYELCKKLGWKQTAASHELNKETGGKECVSQRSWRQIRDTIFPSDTVTVDESHELVARVENETRNEMFLTQFRDSDSLVPTQIQMNTICQPPPTADNTSHVSTVLSEVTAPLTGPTTIAPSDPGPDGKDDIFGFLPYPPVPNVQEYESANSLTGAGKWDTSNLDLGLEPYIDFEQWLNSE